MFYFSYEQEEYTEIKESGRRYLNWQNKKITHKYENCTVSVIGMSDKRARIVLRRRYLGYSKFMESDFEVNLMMGFVMTDVQKNKLGKKTELVFAIQQNNDSHSNLEKVKIWSDDDNESENLYDMIIQTKGVIANTPEIIDPNHPDKFDGMVPVVYQPRVDAWKNFLREINIHEEIDGSYQVTLVFQDEVLRRHWFFDGIYRVIRLLKYKRIVDIESFTIKNNVFFFSDIYSGDNTMFDDNTHNKAEIPVKYYFGDHNHPILFVNTSNHALAPHDNNHNLWKWEYIPWSKLIPIKLGTKAREATEKDYRRF
ncbi:hypothetical protein YTPLAS73_05500 [Nitrosarchaeum sp.]|nr:hypothetical protein YTPLAS73_05500 [Nitrosarchaeum sp.]